MHHSSPLPASQPVAKEKIHNSTRRGTAVPPQSSIGGRKAQGPCSVGRPAVRRCPLCSSNSRRQQAADSTRMCRRQQQRATRTRPRAPSARTTLGQRRSAFPSPSPLSRYMRFRHQPAKGDRRMALAAMPLVRHSSSRSLSEPGPALSCLPTGAAPNARELARLCNHRVAAATGSMIHGCTLLT